MSVYLILLGLFLAQSCHFSEGNTYSEDENTYLRKAVSELVRRNYPEVFVERLPQKKDIQSVEKEDENIDKQVLLDSKGTAGDGTVGETVDSATESSDSSKTTEASEDKPQAQPFTDNNKEQPKSNHIIGIPTGDFYFIAIVTACSLAAIVGLVIAGVCWYKLHKNVKAASEVEYPAYGVTGPAKERMAPPPGDRKLAQSAQMYHYQHQKQQMIAMEKANGEMKHDASEDESEEENEEGDYTVYECPGLAPTGEMEVRNPLFSEETPVAPDPEHSNDPQ